jgi:hypothetical protein
MTRWNHLTNDELIEQFTLRDDLTEMETELLDRLIRAADSLVDLEATLLDVQAQLDDATNYLAVVDGDNS